MKKIVNHPKGIRLDGIVENDGVGFLPIREAGPMFVTTPGFFAYTTDDGTEDCRIVNPDYYEDPGGARTHHKIKEMGKRVMVAAIAMLIVSVVLMFMSTGWKYSEIWVNLFMTIMYAMIVVMMMPNAFAIFVGRVSHDKMMTDFSKYLGAKNAVENAYYDLGRAPNIEEAIRYSIHANDCKYTKLTHLASLVCIICCVRFLTGWWYWLAAVLAILVLTLLEAKNLLTAWQCLVVSKPTDEHYNVAIKAMQETAEMIDSIQISYHMVVVEGNPEDSDEEKCEEDSAYDFCEDASKKNKNEENHEDEAESDTNPASENAVDGDAEAES